MSLFPPRARPAGGARQRRILVVDDEAELRAQLAETLSAIGYEVATAASGEEALPILARDRAVALVISDVRMSGMSGTELSEHIARRWPGVKVVLISGTYVPQVGAGHFLRKPFHLSELAALVRAEIG